jgi:hypothetical protein
MNKAQREVAEALRKREAEIEKELRGAYESALEDIREKIKVLSADPGSQSKIYQIKYQQELEKQVSSALTALENTPDTVEGYLRDVFADSYIGSRYSLNSQGIGIVTALNEKAIAKTVFKTIGDFTFSQRLYSNLSQLKTQVKAEIARGLSNGSSYTDIARQVAFRTEADRSKAERIARTEGHRIQSEARLDSMAIAKENGADIVKVWDATLDTHTREDHQAADQQVREIDEQFEVGGYLTDGPGLTGIASEDINCRCIVLELPRWALADNTLRRDNEYGTVLECENYKDFKDKYLMQIGSDGKLPEDTFEWSRAAQDVIIDIDKIKTQKGLNDFFEDRYGIPFDKAIAKKDFDKAKDFAKGIAQVFEDFSGTADSVSEIVYGSTTNANAAFAFGSSTKGRIVLSPRGLINGEVGHLRKWAIHEALHAVDFTLTAKTMGVYDTLASEKIIRQALRDMGLRSNSRKADDFREWFFGQRARKAGEDKKPYEVFAYSLSSEMTGGGNAFSRMLLTVLRREFEKL